MSEKRETRRAEEAVEIDGRRHVLRELTARARFVFLETQALREEALEKGASLQADKSCPEAVLLSLALTDETGAPVKPEVIDGWPSSLVAELATKAAVLSRLGGKAGNG